MTAKAGERVAICTVTGGPPNWPYVRSIFGLRTPGEKMFYYLKGKLGVDEAHNAIIRWFLEATDFEWMLHLDSDAVVHPDTLIRLLSWGKPFVSALAFQRKPPFVPVVYAGVYTGDDGNEYHTRPVMEVLQWMGEHPELVEKMGQPVVLDPRPDDALIEVDRGGAHCLLTHRSVFEAIPDPWFVRVARLGTGGGSDFDFYAKAQKAGFTAYLDRSVLAGHLTDEHVVSGMDFAVWSRACVWTDGGRPSGFDVVLPRVEIETENKEE